MLRPRAEDFLELASAAADSSILEGLHESDAAFLFSRLYLDSGGLFVWLCEDNRQARRIGDNLSFFLGSGRAVLVIPGTEANPYRGLSPHPEIAEKRALGLWRLLEGHRGFAVTTVASLLTRTIPPAAFLNACLRLDVGDFISMTELQQRLRRIGYVREDPVSGPGGFSGRGGILDVYSPAHSNPLRFEFFGDEIHSLREFDPGSQRSTRLVPSCQIVPMREFVASEEDVENWHRAAPRRWSGSEFAEALEEKRRFTEFGELFDGFEYLLPLVIESGHHLLDFLPARPRQLVVQQRGQILEESSRLAERLQDGYEEQLAAGEPALEPARLYLAHGWLEERLDGPDCRFVERVWEGPEPSRRLDFQSERVQRAGFQDLLRDLESWRSAREQVVFVMKTPGMAQRLVDILRGYDLEVAFCAQGMEAALAHPVAVTVGRISEGFYSPGLGLHVLSQENVFGGEQAARARPPAHRDVASAFLSDFRDLKGGDFVVHVDHGIGRFSGLSRIGVGDEIREFVLLTYRDEARLYVPVDRLDLVQKYSGGGETAPRLDRLGGVSWERTKTRIKKSMQDLARDLLKLYARRQTVAGFAFSPDDALCREFEEAFEYEETPDQRQAIADIKRDMQAPRPMDRLVCGDVGYGKTEVAMRAAFHCVKDSKQVALLAPTTVLAFQHFANFRERFRGFPVRVEMISRFQSRKEQTRILQDCLAGRVDILLGTHRLLSRDVNFSDLGLIVVDEEQRFGVGQKERLKGLKTRVDVLSLSATPIPRTLNMALLGLRDLSIIETPPKDRLAIQTAVTRFRRSIIRNAIDLELEREGQVLFVHNSIETIHSMAAMVQETVPDALIRVAHGRLRENHLEQVMLDFLNHRFDVLVATTIIENGLDIPRANTLIVNRADHFGLAQLYQLRGRVGRSDRRAYAYFLVSSEEVLRPDARRRLAAIKEFSDLGAGFRLAALDLEIRGAGNMLGAEQHGHIGAVGFELYVKLLKEEIRRLQDEEVVEEVRITIDLGQQIQIPEHYVEDSSTRLWMYKRIAMVTDEAELENLKDEVVDRFGHYPRPVANLFEYARLRQRARKLRVTSMEVRAGRLLLKLHDDTPVSRTHIIELVGRGDGFSMDSEGVLSARLDPAAEDLFPRVHALLDEIAVLE